MLHDVRDVSSKIKILPSEHFILINHSKHRAKYTTPALTSKLATLCPHSARVCVCVCVCVCVYVCVYVCVCVCARARARARSVCLTQQTAELFYYQLMHIMLKNTELLKHSKITLQHVPVYIETIYVNRNMLERNFRMF